MIERAAYRIIDANFNRSREALRVIEEYARFVLDHAGLAARAKAMRHRLSAAIGRLDGSQLLASRDSTSDVGAGMTVEGQLRRTDLQDCLTAACKRLPEALRVLAEVVQGHDPSLSQIVEQLRYEAYTLEKDVAQAAGPGRLFRQVALYVIISTDLPAEALTLTSRCIAGGADCLQLRCKQMADRSRWVLGQEFVRMCKDAGVVSIINDRVDLATACDADGVHLGLDDLPVAVARRLQHKPLIIGATTHNQAELTAACTEHPTYVAVGPAFATATKPDLAPAGLEYIRPALSQLSAIGVGHVAIGGITHANMDQVLACGARTLAFGSAVADSRDPVATCKALKERILWYRSSQRS
jgi:thiamine-phosphate pyrophosphorylase